MNAASPWLDFTGTTHTPSYGIFEVSGRYSFSDRYNLHFGVDTLLDEERIVNLRMVAEGYTQAGVTNGAYGRARPPRTTWA